MADSEREQEDRSFAEVEAKLLAEKEAHARRIAQENSKKRKPPPVMIKRPVFAATNSRGERGSQGGARLRPHGGYAACLLRHSSS